MGSDARTRRLSAPPYSRSRMLANFGNEALSYNNRKCSAARQEHEVVDMCRGAETPGQ
jgi:hypothetical protein